MPRYAVEVEEIARTIRTHIVELDAADAVDAEHHVNAALDEAGHIDGLLTHLATTATVMLDGEEDGGTDWQTASVWEVIEPADPRQGILFPLA